MGREKRRDGESEEMGRVKRREGREMGREKKWGERRGLVRWVEERGEREEGTKEEGTKEYGTIATRRAWRRSTSPCAPCPAAGAAATPAAPPP